MAAVVAEVTGVALALATDSAETTVTAHSTFNITLSLRALGRHIPFAGMAFPIRVAKAFSKTAVAVHRAVVGAAFRGQRRFAG